MRARIFVLFATLVFSVSLNAQTQRMETKQALRYTYIDGQTVAVPSMYACCVAGVSELTAKDGVHHMEPVSWYMFPHAGNEVIVYTVTLENGAECISWGILYRSNVLVASDNAIMLSGTTGYSSLLRETRMICYPDGVHFDLINSQGRAIIEKSTGTVSMNEASVDYFKRLRSQIEFYIDSGSEYGTLL